jgi:glycosyltransferase involved in cell wall biosynthesis
MDSAARPRVSVCITTYNHVRFIRQCLESVLDQAFGGSIEVLVGDDGSTDGTRDVVRALAASDARIVPVFHDVQLGPSANLSNLVARGGGDYIAHLDGDDYWLPGKLSAQLQCLAGRPDTVAVCCNAYVVSHDDRRLGRFNRGRTRLITAGELLSRGNFLCHSTLLYRRQAIDAVLGMTPPYVDYRIHLRLLALGSLAYLDEPLAAYRWRAPGSMTTSMPDAVMRGLVDAFEEALARGADANDVRAGAGVVFGQVLVRALLCRKPAAAMRIARRFAGIDGLHARQGWAMAQALRAPFRAATSVWFRHRGIYFPRG